MGGSKSRGGRRKGKVGRSKSRGGRRKNYATCAIISSTLSALARELLA